MNKDCKLINAEIYDDSYILERIQILFPKSDARKIAKQIDEMLNQDFDIERDYTQLYAFAIQYQLDDCDVDKVLELINLIDKKYRQSQNYLNIKDIITPIYIYIDENNNIMFGLQKTFVPAKGQIFYELPEIVIPEKMAKYEKEYIIKTLEQLDINTQNVYSLSNDFTPVSQSFTNQKALPVVINVDTIDSKDKTMEWLSLGKIEEVLESGINMSLQTRYALLLTLNKYKNIIETLKDKKEEVKLDIDETTYNSTSHVIWPRKYRFGVSQIDELNPQLKEKISNKEVKFSNDSCVFGLSKDSVQCVVTRINEDGKVLVALSKQLRSPFISEGYENAFFYECSAGMIDETDGLTTCDIEEIGKNAALRETKEETGIMVDEAIKLCPTTLLSLRTEESSLFYLCEIPYEYSFGGQNLDDGESIDDVEWFALDELDIANLNSPMPTKLALLETRKFYAENSKKRIRK